MGSERRVVITGIGVVSPNGVGREQFAQALAAGISGVRRISRFDPSEGRVHIAGEVVGLLENGYISPKDRQIVARTVPLSIAASEEALQDAGLNPAQMDLEARRGVGVVLGSGGGSHEFTEEQYRRYYTGQLKRVSVYTVPSSTWGALPSELSMKFGFRGFSHLISTGCTSSTDALGYAFQNIRCRVTDTVLAGGADAPLAPLILRAFEMMRVLTSSWNHAPGRASRPFSRDRDGFVIAEGSWMFVLEELEHARTRGAKIYAEIKGYGSTCDAYHRVRLDGSGEEPARAMRLALEQAGKRPEQVDYVSLHGTSTVLNDRIETRALKLCLGKHGYRIPMSALKSLIGHPQGACGAAGVAATVLAMRDGVLSPTINLDEADPECDLDYVPEIGRHRKVQTALCNCIGFGSKNSALVIEKYPTADDG
ncbi:beta-ketoacyl-[acyl-carrier-protein] synthase family protein [Acidobacteriia bacterium AH_259_A11_L15]|nr:beta-ketoacyl-[acyl-carrier-protein] synthase family protein [Acidobacteriia bacterium AH_259_A11_L15]